MLDSDLTEDQRDCAMTIQRCSDGLLLIINDVLNFSKLEAGKMELQRINFSISRIFDDVGEVLIVQAAEKKLGLYFIIDSKVSIFSNFWFTPVTCL
jgi:two-component system, sensor histidine kinase and response regulator